jgi:hypothetical protein
VQIQEDLVKRGLTGALRTIAKSSKGRLTLGHPFGRGPELLGEDMMPRFMCRPSVQRIMCLQMPEHLRLQVLLDGQKPSAEVMSTGLGHPHSSMLHQLNKPYLSNLLSRDVKQPNLNWSQMEVEGHFQQTEHQTTEVAIQ